MRTASPRKMKSPLCARIPIGPVSSKANPKKEPEVIWYLTRTYKRKIAATFSQKILVSFEITRIEDDSTMDVATAKRTQQECFEQMRKGGMKPIERMDCFKKFETSNPDIELVKQFYDMWGAEYDIDMVVAEYKNTVDVASETEKFFPNNKDIKILDVGAGTGLGGKDLAACGFTNIDATDGSSGMLEEAKKLDVYKNILPAEVLVKGQKMLSVAPGTYDVIASSGSFYPCHLQGYHLPCFLDCVKTGGLLIISSCPHNDEGVNLRPVLAQLEADGIIKIVKETYVPKWFRDDDGDVFVLEKLNPLD
jgi:predicted TPR repeat methyltransferase